MIFCSSSPSSVWGAMVSTMVIKVRYFGTSKLKVAGRERYLKAPIGENGQLVFDIKVLREMICRTCYLPVGSDISLVYIDEDGDVVTLVDDNDLREAMRQRLKSFRIDVLMNDDKVYRKPSSKRSTRMAMEPVKSCYAAQDDKANPHLGCFKGNYLEAIGGMLLQTGLKCNGCGCNPLTGDRFKSIV